MEKILEKSSNSLGLFWFFFKPIKCKKKYIPQVLCSQMVDPKMTPIYYSGKIGISQSSFPWKMSDLVMNSDLTRDYKNSK